VLIQEWAKMRTDMLTIRGAAVVTDDDQET
jgi:hypothetical protein